MGRASRRTRELRVGFPPGLSSDGAPLEKISARLVEVAGCLMGEDARPEVVRWGIGLAALGWNLSLLPEEARDRAMAEVLAGSEEKAGIAGIAPDLLGSILERFVEQKRLLYPDDSRMILNWQVRMSRRQAHVTVVSTLPGED